MGVGFRIIGDLKGASANIQNRMGYGAKLFFHVEWEETIFDVYAGAHQITKELKDETYTFTEKSMYGGLQFGWGF